jgi:CBS domain-containing protein
MTTVRNILQDKGNTVWFASPGTPVLDALRTMAEKNVGALLVMKENDVVGIFSERDYARKLILHGRSPGETKVKEIMTSDVISVKPEQSIDECMALMTQKHVRHLPVLENRKVVGLVSIGDVVKAVIAEKEHLIKQLENYITGTR